MQDRMTEDLLDYPWTERTRFRLRVAFFPDGHTMAMFGVGSLRTLQDAREEWMSFLEEKRRDGMPASNILPADVFDEYG